MGWVGQFERTTYISRCIKFGIGESTLGEEIGGVRGRLGVVLVVPDASGREIEGGLEEWGNSKH